MLPGRVWTKTLLDLRFHVVGWGIGLAILGVVAVGFYPTIEDQPGFTDYWESLPEGTRKFLGDIDDITSVGGYLESQLLIMLPLMLGVFVVLQGAAAIAGEEEAKTADFLFALPLSRRRILLEKALALLVASLLVLLVVAVATTLAALVIGLDFPLWRIAVAPFDAFPPVAVAAGVAVLGSALTTKRRAALIGAAVVVGSYFFGALVQLADATEDLRYLSYLYWSDRSSPLGDGLDWLAIVLNLGLAAVLLWTAAWAVERKELHG